MRPQIAVERFASHKHIVVQIQELIGQVRHQMKQRLDRRTGKCGQQHLLFGQRVPSHQIRVGVNVNARIVQVQPVRKLSVGDDVDVADPGGGMRLERAQREEQFVFVVESGWIEMVVLLDVVKTIRLGVAPQIGQEAFLGTVHPGVDNVDLFLFRFSCNRNHPVVHHIRLGSANPAGQHSHLDENDEEEERQTADDAGQPPPPPASTPAEANGGQDSPHARFSVSQLDFILQHNQPSLLLFLSSAPGRVWILGSRGIEFGEVFRLDYFPSIYYQNKLKIKHNKQQLCSLSISHSRAFPLLPL